MTVYFLKAKMIDIKDSKYFTNNKIYKIKCIKNNERGNEYYIQNDKKEYVLLSNAISINYSCSYKKIKFHKKFNSYAVGEISFKVFTVDKKYFYYDGNFHEVKKYGKIINED